MSVEALQARISTLADTDAQRRERLRQRIRAIDADFTALVDDCRRVFGGAKIVYVRDIAAGQEWGKPGLPGVRPVLSVDIQGAAHGTCSNAKARPKKDSNPIREKREVHQYKGRTSGYRYDSHRDV